MTKNLRTKQPNVKCWWNWYLTGPFSVARETFFTYDAYGGWRHLFYIMFLRLWKKQRPIQQKIMFQCEKRFFLVKKKRIVSCHVSSVKKICFSKPPIWMSNICKQAFVYFFPVFLFLVHGRRIEAKRDFFT